MEENIFNVQVLDFKTTKNAVFNKKFMFDIKANGIKNSIIKITEEFITRMGGIW